MDTSNLAVNAAIGMVVAPLTMVLITLRGYIPEPYSLEQISGLALCAFAGLIVGILNAIIVGNKAVTAFGAFLTGATFLYPIAMAYLIMTGYGSKPTLSEIVIAHAAGVLISIIVGILPAIVARLTR